MKITPNFIIGCAIAFLAGWLCYHLFPMPLSFLATVGIGLIIGATAKLLDNS